MMLTAATPDQPPATHDLRVVRAFEIAGAVSPDTARALGDVTNVDAPGFVRLVGARVIREGASGRYYVHARTERERRRAYLFGALAAGLLMLPSLLRR